MDLFPWETKRFFEVRCARRRRAGGARNAPRLPYPPIVNDRLRTSLVGAILAGAIMTSGAASADPQRVDTSLIFLERRDDHLRRQSALFGYLAGAAGVSLAAGTALWFRAPPGLEGTPEEQRRSFAMIALIYGALNTVFAAASFAGLPSQRERLWNNQLLDWDRERQARAFAGNAALDLLYISLGVTLSATDPRPIVKGMGASIALQGGFLLGLDGGGAAAMAF